LIAQHGVTATAAAIQQDVRGVPFLVRPRQALTSVRRSCRPQAHEESIL
jgi:hypothetical protein